MMQKIALERVRLLHLKDFRSVHYIHHRSVPVSPWSEYCVHPMEAAFIGFSAPIFRYLFPMSLGVVLTFHVMGMAFTMLIHQIFRLTVKLHFHGWLIPILPVMQRIITRGQ